MPPRSLTGTLFAAAAGLWWLLVGLLLVFLAPEENTLDLGFWLGAMFAVASGFGWGALAGARLVRRHAARGGVLRFAFAGLFVLLGAGATALLAGLLLTALVSGPAATGASLHQALDSPGPLALVAATVALVGAPFGAAAGIVLRALAAADVPAGNGGSHASPRR